METQEDIHAHLKSSNAFASLQAVLSCTDEGEIPCMFCMIYNKNCTFKTVVPQLLSDEGRERLIF